MSVKLRKSHGLAVATLFAFASFLGGCGSSPEEGPTTSTRFRGAYVASAPESAIAGILFEDASHYRIARHGCETASCVETGTYTVDDVRKTLTLTSATNGQTTLPIEIRASKKSATMRPQTKDLLSDEDEGEELVAESSDLLEEEVTLFMAGESLLAAHGDMDCDRWRAGLGWCLGKAA